MLAIRLMAHISLIAESEEKMFGKRSIHFFGALLIALIALGANPGTAFADGPEPGTAQRMPGPARPGVPAPPGTGLTVTGSWGYYRRTDYIAAVGFRVELVNGTTDAHLADCYTDDGGYYTCGPVTNPGADGVRTKLWTYALLGPGPDTLAVVNPDLGSTAQPDNGYSATQPASQVFEDGTFDIGNYYIGPVADPVKARAYFIMGDLEQAWSLIWYNGGSSAVPPKTAGSQTVLWKNGSTDGPSYTYGGAIHLASANPMSNYLTTKMYAHNILYRAYGNTVPSCGSIAAINKIGTESCAWLEGWTDFLVMVTNNSPVLLSDYTSPATSPTDLEAPNSTTSGWDAGQAVEGRVAGALWDLYDSVNDGSDAYTTGGFSNFQHMLYNHQNNTFLGFWSDWIGSGFSQVNAVPSVVQNTIQPPATFVDVPTNHSFWRFVEGLYTAGVTSGCSVTPKLYCPDNQVTRSQMAIFLLRGHNGKTYAPPAATGTLFGDVKAGDFAADFIEQMYTDGITTGCSASPRLYCPNNPVTRAQMAIFLLRAKYGSTYKPPAATGTLFADVKATDFAADFIEQMYAEGITTGCNVSPRMYCPNNSVTRGQMAVFLVRAFSLP